MRDGQLLLLENTRFLPGEQTNDDALAARLARLGDFFVNDAFGTLHRSHASTVGVAGKLRPAAAGLLVERELEALSALGDPPRPFVVGIGGAKISGKIDLLDAVIERADSILIGGAMANTFLRAQGTATGASLVETDALGLARSITAAAGRRMRLPTDVTATRRMDDRDAPTEDLPADAIGPGMAVGDIGPATRRRYAEEVAECGSFFWNGPMGVFEDARFTAGTFALAEAAAKAAGAGALAVIGGGDSAAAVRRAGVADEVSHVCTGGGAALEYLASGSLCGLSALDASAGALAGS